MSDWEESDWEEEPEDDEPLQEVRFGVHFVRHKKTHKVGGRLGLDDALGQLAAAQAAAEAAKKKLRRSGAAGGRPEGGAAAAEHRRRRRRRSSRRRRLRRRRLRRRRLSRGCRGARARRGVQPGGPDGGGSDARKKAWSNREKNENQYYYRFNAPRRGTERGQVVRGGARAVPEDAGGCAQRRRGTPMYQWGSFSKNIPGRVGTSAPTTTTLAHQERRG